MGLKTKAAKQRRASSPSFQTYKYVSPGPLPLTKTISNNQHTSLPHPAGIDLALFPYLEHLATIRAVPLGRPRRYVRQPDTLKVEPLLPAVLFKVACGQSKMNGRVSHDAIGATSHPRPWDFFPTGGSSPPSEHKSRNKQAK